MTRPAQHFQTEFDEDRKEPGFISDRLLLKWFNEAYSTSKHLLTLYSLARGLSAKHILEIGFGRSSIVLARAASETGGRFVCCDQRDFSYAFNEDERRVTEFVCGKSEAARTKFEETGIDFAFLDYFSSNQVTDGFIANEIAAVLSLMKTNGIVAVHDVSVPEYKIGQWLKKHARGSLFRPAEFDFFTLPYNYGLGLVQKRSSSRFGALPDLHLKKPEIPA